MLPPSPARWRPLKLSIELQSICVSGSLSTITHLRQLQYDAASDAACPGVEAMRFDRDSHRLSWEGERHGRFELSFHQNGDGRMLGRQEVIGSSAQWPAAVRRPVVIQAVRACGDVQRSRATFLLVE